MAGTAQTAADSFPGAGEDSGLPPCQAAAGDPEGAFTTAAAEGGRGDKVSATMFSSPVMCQMSSVYSAR